MYNAANAFDTNNPISPLIVTIQFIKIRTSTNPPAVVTKVKIQFLRKAAITQNLDRCHANLSTLTLKLPD